MSPLVRLFVPKRELVDVQRKVLAADFVERADNSSFHQRPETFDGLSVNVAMPIFAYAVMYHAVRKVLVDVAIASVIVGRDQADLMRDSLAHKGVKSFGASVVDDAGDHVAFALHGSDDDGFSVPACSAEVSPTAFAFVLLSYVGDV
jgi:hypothetical protein